MGGSAGWPLRRGAPVAPGQLENVLSPGSRAPQHPVLRERIEYLARRPVIEVGGRDYLAAGDRAAGVLQRRDRLIDIGVEVGEVLGVNKRRVAVGSHDHAPLGSAGPWSSSVPAGRGTRRVPSRPR